MKDLIKVCEIALQALMLEEVRLHQDFKKKCEDLSYTTALSVCEGTREFEISTYVISERRREVEKIRDNAYESMLEKKNRKVGK